MSPGGSDAVENSLPELSIADTVVCGLPNVVGYSSAW